MPELTAFLRKELVWAIRYNHVDYIREDLRAGAHMRNALASRRTSQPLRIFVVCSESLALEQSATAQAVNKLETNHGRFSLPWLSTSDRPKGHPEQWPSCYERIGFRRRTYFIRRTVPKGETAVMGNPSETPEC